MQAQSSGRPPAENHPSVSTGKGRVGRVIAFLIRITAIGVPVLYLIGRVYLEGYWNALGLPSSFADLDVDDYLYTGFVALIAGSANLLGVSGDRTGLIVMVGGATLSLLTAAIALFDHWLMTSVRWRLKGFETKAAAWRQKHHFAIKKFALPSLVSGFGFYLFCLVIFVGLLVVLSGLLVIHKAGKVSGELDIKRFAEQSNDTSRPLATAQFTLSDGTKGQGLLLECSTQWCFVFNGRDFTAVPAPAVTAIGQPIKPRPIAAPPGTPP